MDIRSSVNRNLDSYTIIDTNTIVKPGDSVLMRSPDSETTNVAQIKNIMIDNGNNVTVRVRKYYRPEDSIRGRKPFHGGKELFLSDQYDIQSAYTIESKCMVHSIKNYTKLENIGAGDYYCRFEYKATMDLFSPSSIVVYCKCQMPKNPDIFMLQCEECKDWYHPSCLNLTKDQAKQLDSFICSDCNEDEDET